MGRNTDLKSDGTAERMPLLPVMPLAALAAAWALDVSTRDALGAWRYVFVVPLSVYGVCFGAVLLMIGFAQWATRPERHRRREWLRRLSKAAPAIIAAVLLADIVEFGYRWDHSGPTKALEKLPWAGLAAIVFLFFTWRADRRRGDDEPLSADVPAAQADEPDPGQ